VIQFARIALTVTLTPLIFSLLEGRALGSAAGVSLSRGPMGAADAAVMISAGAVGFFGARLLRLPAAQILGPILASGAVHALGWTDAAPPGWLVGLAQLVIGVTLGLRFVGVPPRTLARYFALSPGGVIEMGLIAVSLEASPIFVTAHHLVRIIATVAVAAAAWRRIGAL
jgi:hypothetical protein